MFCPNRRFVFRCFVVRRSVHSAFVTSTFCRWIENITGLRSGQWFEENYYIKSHETVFLGIKYFLTFLPTDILSSLSKNQIFSCREFGLWAARCADDDNLPLLFSLARRHTHTHTPHTPPSDDILYTDTHVCAKKPSPNFSGPVLGRPMEPLQVCTTEFSGKLEFPDFS